MAAKLQHLRVASDDEAPKKRKSVAEAAASGSRRELLVAMRDRIAKTVADPDCPPRDLAALSRRLQDIAKDIDSLDLLESEEQSVVVKTDDDGWDQSTI
jgi:hypothetical protein